MILKADEIHTERSKYEFATLYNNVPLYSVKIILPACFYIKLTNYF